MRIIDQRSQRAEGRYDVGISRRPQGLGGILVIRVIGNACRLEPVQGPPAGIYLNGKGHQREERRESEEDDSRQHNAREDIDKEHSGKKDPGQGLRGE